MAKLAYFIKYSPMAVIGIISAIHSIVYGIGYVFMLPEFQNTVLYPAVASLIDPRLFGVVLLLVGIASVVAFTSNRPKWASPMGTTQAMIWLFAALVYFLTGAVALGIGVGLVWSVLNAYAAFVFANREDTIMVLANEHYARTLSGEDDDL